MASNLGTEAPLSDQVEQLSSQVHPVRENYVTQPIFDEIYAASVKEPTRMRTSSIYSMESSQSSDTLGSTISEILDMYTDLINKIPYSKAPSDCNIWEPRAYRDTVAPLLRTMLSGQDSPSLPSPILPLQSAAADPKLKEQSLSALKESHKQAPGFQEFSRNLRDRRARLGSPFSTVSTVSSEDCPRPCSDSISEPSPIASSPQRRPFSWITSNQGEGFDSHDERAVAPFHDLERVQRSEALPAAYGGGRPSRPSSSGHQENTAEHHETNQTSTYKTSQRPVGYPHSLQTLQNRTVQERFSPETSSGRYYQHLSPASDSSSGDVIRPGMSDRVRSKITGKIRVMKASKNNDTSGAVTASRDYTGMQPNSQQVRAPLRERRRQQQQPDKDPMSNAVAPKLMHGVPKVDDPVVAAKSDTARLASPSVTFDTIVGDGDRIAQQIVFNQRQPDDPRYPSIDFRSQLRPQSDNSQSYRHRQHFHRRTTSAHMAESADLVVSHGRMTGLMAALGGAKNNLMQSSAEKRREKLKASIVLIGPSELTEDPASGTSMSLS